MTNLTNKKNDEVTKARLSLRRAKARREKAWKQHKECGRKETASSEDYKYISHACALAKRMRKRVQYERMHLRTHVQDERTLPNTNLRLVMSL